MSRELAPLPFTPPLIVSSTSRVSEGWGERTRLLAANQVQSALGSGNVLQATGIRFQVLSVVLTVRTIRPRLCSLPPRACRAGLQRRSSLPEGRDRRTLCTP